MFYTNANENFNFILGLSQLTLDEEAEDYESVSDQTNTDRRSGDSLLTATRQNTVTTFGFVDKNNAPLPSPSQSFLSESQHSGKNYVWSEI